MSATPDAPPAAWPTPDVHDDTELRLQHPRLRELLDWWERKRGARAMPSREDVRPAELRQHLPALILMEVQHEPLRLYYRLIGTAVVEAVGRDSTGRYSDEIYPPEVLERIYRGYRWLLRERRPLRSYGVALHPDRRCYRFEMLSLPLSRDGAAPDMILAEMIFSLDSGEA